MDWIETTGKTLEEAKEAALDELGVDEEDAEFEVVSEAKSGLFGRVREEARVRARVRPTAPRPKEDRRDRRRRSGTRSSGESSAEGEATDAAGTTTAVVDAPDAAADAGTDIEPAGDGAPATSNGGRRRDREPVARSHGDRDHHRSDVDVPLAVQADAAKGFVVGLIEQFGLSGSVTTTVDEDESVIEVAVEGDGLGLLIGPKGATLLALQDLTRSAVQQKTGAGNGRLNVDVSSYRAKRSEALVRFAQRVAEQVRSSGTRQALEPMSAVDRKTIHDALTDIEGVSTVSEGEDAARRVVILPDGV